MNTTLLKVAEEISREIVALAQSVMENNDIGTNAKVNKNTLRSSALKDNIRASVEVGGSIVIKTYFDNYINYIEHGRAPMSGKRPPISAIRDWALAKGLPTDDSTLYAIAQAIWRDGYAPRPILATLESQINEKFENEWADKLFDALTTELKSQTFLLPSKT
jgi:hypothetical protein